MTQWGLDTLFNPAKRHMDEEKRRLQSTREQLGDSSGGKRIDLESGKVTIRRETTEDDAEVDEKSSDDAASGEVAGEAAATETTKKKAGPPSAAAVRAAQRRGRQPR
jgi:hypothetical protein